MKCGQIDRNRTTKVFLLLAITLLAGSISGCIFPDQDTNTPAQDKVNVMATTVPLGHFIEMVGKDLVNVGVLVSPGTNPHTFEPAPSQLKCIEEAQLYVKNGAGMEIWMDKIIRANEDMLVVDSSKGIDLIESTDPDHDDHNDNSERGLHEVILTKDPHIWLSPRNAIVQVENICDGLVNVDPENEDRYRNNRDDYIKKLEELDSELNATFSKSEKKTILVLHPAWSYFARDYGLEQVSILYSQKEPGLRYLVTMIETARENNVTRVFVDPNFNPKSAEIVANEIGGKVVPLDPLAENYIENMRHVGQEIVASFEP